MSVQSTERGEGDSDRMLAGSVPVGVAGGDLDHPRPLDLPHCSRVLPCKHCGGRGAVSEATGWGSDNGSWCEWCHGVGEMLCWLPLVDGRCSEHGGGEAA